MISVIIPVYNGAQCLGKCIQSVLNQTYRDYEVIVVDDGSTDGTYDICRQFTEKDNRIRLFHQMNAGVSAARNRALAEVRGEYIVFVDADDTLPVTALQALMNGADDVDLVIGAYEACRFGRKKKMEVQEETICGEVSGMLGEIGHLLNTPWGKRFKTSVIRKEGLTFNNSIPYSEDTIFVLSYCKHIQRIQMVSEMVYCYNLGGLASSVRYYSDMHALLMNLLKAYLDFFGGRENVPKPLLKRFVADQFRESVLHYIAHCNYNLAVAKTEETLSLFAPYLDESTVDHEHFAPDDVRYILSKDARGLVKSLGRASWFRILLKKVKYWLYAIKRIK